MLNLDKDALICDLAETYNIYDMSALPVKTIATLAAGLRVNSRIKLKAAGLRVSVDNLILAAIFDRIGSLTYMLSDHSGQPPESMLDGLLDTNSNEPQCAGFQSGAEFEAERQRIIDGIRSRDGTC